MKRREYIIAVASSAMIAGCGRTRNELKPGHLRISNKRGSKERLQIIAKLYDRDPSADGSKAIYKKDPIAENTKSVSVEPKSETATPVFMEPGLYFVNFADIDEEGDVPYERGAWHSLYGTKNELEGSQMSLILYQDGEHRWSFTAV